MFEETKQKIMKGPRKSSIKELTDVSRSKLLWIVLGAIKARVEVE
jgi:hypothetical protein